MRSAQSAATAATRNEGKIISARCSDNYNNIVRAVKGDESTAARRRLAEAGSGQGAGWPAAASPLQRGATWSRRRSPTSSCSPAPPIPAKAVATLQRGENLVIIGPEGKTAPNVQGGSAKQADQSASSIGPEGGAGKSGRRNGGAAGTCSLPDSPCARIASTSMEYWARHPWRAKPLTGLLVRHSLFRRRSARSASLRSSARIKDAPSTCCVLNAPFPGRPTLPDDVHWAASLRRQRNPTPQALSCAGRHRRRRWAAGRSAWCGATGAGVGGRRAPRTRQGWMRPSPQCMHYARPTSRLQPSITPTWGAPALGLKPCVDYVTPGQLDLERGSRSVQAAVGRSVRAGTSHRREEGASGAAQGPAAARGRSALLRWGLVPFFAHGDRRGTRRSMRASRPWSQPPRIARPLEARAALPATGFTGSGVSDDGRKRIHYIHLADQDVFGLAGLWDRSTRGRRRRGRSCTIITMPANDLMAQVHNARARMPAILARGSLKLAGGLASRGACRC